MKNQQILPRKAARAGRWSRDRLPDGRERGSPRRGGTAPDPAWRWLFAPIPYMARARMEDREVLWRVRRQALDEVMIRRDRRGKWSSSKSPRVSNRATSWSAWRDGSSTSSPTERELRQGGHASVIPLVRLPSAPVRHARRHRLVRADADRKAEARGRPWWSLRRPGAVEAWWDSSRKLLGCRAVGIGRREGEVRPGDRGARFRRLRRTTKAETFPGRTSRPRFPKGIDKSSSRTWAEPCWTRRLGAP